MKSPEHERAELLGIAIERAGEVLKAPIDRVKVGRFHIICWAGRRRVRMVYSYAQGGALDPQTGRFTPMPGAGGWNVIVKPTAASTLLGTLRRMLSRRRH